MYTHKLSFLIKNNFLLHIHMFMPFIITKKCDLLNISSIN